MTENKIEPRSQIEKNPKKAMLLCVLCFKGKHMN